MATKLTRWIVALAFAGLMMGVVLVSAGRAQDAAGGLAGDWHGSVASPLGEMRLGLEIKPKEGGGYQGSLSSPDQGGGSLPLDEVTLQNGTLSFSLKRVSGSYQGHWDTGKSAWVGQWTQGASTPLVLTRGKPAPRPVIAGLDGNWEGALTNAAGGKLRLVLRIHTGDGGTVALLDSPDQLAYGFPVADLARDGQKITFGLKAIGAGYSGVLSADRKAIAGAWTQGATNPLTFTWTGAKAAEPRRPQTPKKPYPYREEEVFIDSAPGVRLAGTLTLPRGKGPFPAAVMITGSGAQDRDETLLGHKPFLVIADRLTRDGIAVLRVDDRGFAKSTGDFSKATTRDFAVDAAANVAFLRGRPDIDPARVGLIGHSEGGVVAPMVAAKDPRLAFVVLLAGPGMPLAEVLSAQRAALGPSMGLGPQAVKASQKLFDDGLAAMRGAKDDADAEARALKVLVPEAAAMKMPANMATTLARQLSSTWMRELLDYDPRPALRQVTSPVLALNGSKDMQVPPDQSLPAIREALKGNRDVTVIELPGLNHLFQTAPTGAAGEYADIEETIAPIALDTLSDWIVKHTAAKPAAN